MTSGPRRADNLQTAERWIRKAAAEGAKLVALPENFSWMGPQAEREKAAENLDGPTLERMAALAKELRVAVLAGSFLERGAPGGRFYNTSVLLDENGQHAGVYRKIHLFDVEIGDGASYRESAAVAPGTEVVVARVFGVTVGLSICYDLRFPELYRRLASLGATLLVVPSAFTLMTGKDHWEVLLRARAIENLAYVLAPAQHGRHSENRITYGHSMLVDPWGLVAGMASDGEGLVIGTVDDQLISRVRTSLPVLAHRRL
jgi:predicted amidohydrolase